MQKIIIAFGFTLAFSQVVFAQDDTTTTYIYGLPSTGEDTVEQYPQRDLYPPNWLEEVKEKDLPSRLRKALEEDELYKGWRNSPVYMDKNTDLYVLHLNRRGTIYTYYFDKNGNPVSINTFRKPRN